MSREEILAGARELIDAHGLRELSMPGLAHHLGSGVTSIYWYFGCKDDLLVALAEEVANELYARLPPVGGRPWDEELLVYFSAFRERAREMPVYLELFGHHARLLFARAAGAQIRIVRRLEDELSVLVGAGFTPEKAAHVYAVCSAYVRGFVLLEHGLEAEHPETGVDDAVDSSVATLEPAHFPTLTRLSSFRRTMWLDDVHFQLGLRLLIAGIRRELEEETTCAAS